MVKGIIFGAFLFVRVLTVVSVGDQVALVKDHTGKEYVILHDDTRLQEGTRVIGAVSNNGTRDTADDYVTGWVHPDDIR